MKKIFFSLAFMLCPLFSMWGQQVAALDQLKADPRKAYGNDYPYLLETPRLTPAPRGYKPFYISHYARHGSRYYWSSSLYKELDTLLTVAHQRQLLTPAGEAFCQKFMAAKQELQTGVSELTELGWQQLNISNLGNGIYPLKAILSKNGRQRGVTEAKVCKSRAVVLTHVLPNPRIPQSRPML